jgi:hypothetical protein
MNKPRPWSAGFSLLPRKLCLYESLGACGGDVVDRSNGVNQPGWDGSVACFYAALGRFRLPPIGPGR